MKIAYAKHFDEKDFNAAITAYQQVISNFPESEEAAEAQFRIANIYHWNTVEPEKAIVEYQKVIDNYPNTDYAIESLIRTGEAYGRLKQFDKALAYFQRVITEHPASDYVPRAKLNLANTLLHNLHDPTKASGIYDEVLAEYTETEYAVEASLWRTYIRQQNKELTNDQAIAAYQQILVSPLECYYVKASAQYMVAYAHYLKGEGSQAITEFQKVLTNYPESYLDHLAETYYFLGHIYEQKTEYQLALQQYQKAVSLYPKSIWAERIQKRIQRVYRKQKAEELLKALQSEDLQ